jgi:cytidine deaminase
VIFLTFEELITRAEEVFSPRQLTKYTWVGSVAAAILSEKGNVYTGVCIDVCSGIGFCAEHAAIAAMITAGESRILKIVAVAENGVIPPCGRCREFIAQINEENISAEIMVAKDKTVTLNELIPYRWEKAL